MKRTIGIETVDIEGSTETQNIIANTLSRMSDH